jgi:DNA-binding Lrp family transcriptional regulator
MSERQARGWALALTSTAFLMVTLDALVVVTALPAIQRDLHAGVGTVEWTVNAFTLAYAAGIITAASHARLRRLAADGALKPFSQRVDLAALGYELAAFLSLSVSQTDPRIVQGLLGLPEVISAHYTSGDADLLVQVVAKNTRDLYRITTSILTIEGVNRTSTAVSLVEPIPNRPHALLRAAAGS